MVQIPIAGSSTKFYTVEARRYTGYEEQIPGEAVVIHKVDESLGQDRPARVVDPDNNGDPNDEGAMWKSGETFMDSGSGISIKVTAETANGFDVTINPSSSGGDGGGSDTVAPTGSVLINGEAASHQEPGGKADARRHRPLSG